MMAENYVSPFSILESDLSTLEDRPLVALQVVGDHQHEGEDHNSLEQYASGILVL